MNGILLLEDGTIYLGEGFGAPREAICEMVLNTGMSGYTEALSDPGYAGQGVVMTFPEIGNHGISRTEIKHPPALSALIVRDYHSGSIDPRSGLSLDQWLKQEGVPGLARVDTRALARHLRENGTLRGLITFEEAPDLQVALEKIRAWQMPDPVPAVSVEEPRFFPHTGPSCGKRLTAIDYGSGLGLIRELNDLGADVTLLPHHTTAAEVIETDCDAILLTSGPGDPQACPKRIAVIRELLTGGKPLLAIGLGHQLLCLATGLESEKMHFGHRGTNHPVRRLSDGKLFVTAQNHGYVIKRIGLEHAVPAVEVTYEHVNDRTIEGIRLSDRAVWSYQFHPEARPGPADTRFVFADFLANLPDRP